jgi:hypothetical protein
MTASLGVLDALLTIVSGAALAGHVRTRLTLLERALIAITAGAIVGSALTYGLALALGLNHLTVLAGPALLGVAALAVAQWHGDPRTRWRDSWVEARAGWRERPPWVALTVGGGAAAVVALIFAHALFTTGAELDAGYPTVWADWSQHLSTTASFAVGANLPPQNPLLSGTPLLYPFLPDFHSATLMALGLSAPAALAIPSAVLVLVCALLIVALAQRLGLGAGAGVIAVLVCFLGGGVGFEALFADACTNHGFTVAECTLKHVVTHPAELVTVIPGTLRELPGAILAQPRAYDGLPSGGGPAPFDNMQWYTPLLAWWLPQRTFAYGFALALAVLILVFAAVGEPRRGWDAFVVAGLLLGLLPLVHVQTLIALAPVLVVLAARHRRREWLALLGVVMVVAAPRLAQLAVSAHGSAAFQNAYPSLRPGWYANTGSAADPSKRLSLSPLNFVVATGQAAEQLARPQWWAFWVANLGVAVPLCAVVVIGTALRLFAGAAGALGRRLTGLFPTALLELALAATLIFALCNVLVVSSWDWDNTKLLVYWYLAVGLLVGALATRWWRLWWRGIAATAMVVTTLLTGALILVRLLPITPDADAATNRTFTIISAQERALAAEIDARTAQDAVFLTFGRPNDPVLAVAGRPGVMGYYGWLWSYGVDFGARYGDVLAMYHGCAATPASCPVPSLLRKYKVSYVEIDDRLGDPGAIQPAADLRWWASQGFRVVARTDHITLYDVRSGG